MTQQSLNEILLALLGSQELVEAWWSSPNKTFDMEIPDDLMHTNRKNEVIRYILAQTGGEYI
jgi:uncharacterized protein (DUF2384 family)